MKRIFRLLFLGGLFLSSCEEDPVIQTDGFKTQPAIYCIINSEDTVHYIRIGRMFSGISDPDETMKIPDSIYYRSLDVQVKLHSVRDSMMMVPVTPGLISDKLKGPFDNGDFFVYQFTKKLLSGTYPSIALRYDSVYVDVNLPGAPAARCSTSLVHPPRIWWPIQAAQYIFIYPDNPMRVLWSGDAWNEIDVEFIVHEQYPDSTLKKVFTIQKTNDVHWNGLYYEIKVPYELIVQMLEKGLAVRNDIVRRYFGKFRIEIHTGNQDFDVFFKFHNGINDFNYNAYSNVENGIGMLSAKSSVIKESMYLDQQSRLKFAIEPALTKFRFIEY